MAGPSDVTGLREHRVDVEGITLAVHEYGTGPDLVWLHGSGPGASGLSNFADNLDAFEDHRNLVVDLPRFGDSDHPEIDEPLYPYVARRVVGALTQLGVEQAAVVGNSYGGAIAAKIAIEYPELVRRLILMAPGIAPDGLQELPEGVQILFDYMSQPEPSEAGLEKFIRTMLYDESLFTEELLKARFAVSRRNHPEIALPPNNGTLNEDLHRIVAPTLVLWGRDDRTVPLSWAPPLIGALRDVELRVYSQCGHWVQFEARSQFNQAVHEFVAEER